VIKIPHHRVSIAQTMFTYLKALTTRCFYVVLFSTSWLSLSWFEVVRYGNIRTHEYTNISSFLIFHLSVTHLLLHLSVPIFWNIQFSKGNSSSCKALGLIDYACAALSHFPQFGRDRLGPTQKRLAAF